VQKEPVDRNTSIQEQMYILPSGIRTKCRYVLIGDPEAETVVWEGNPRAGEKPNTSDIDGSILSNGTNSNPAILRYKGGVLEVLAGSRRRASTISVRKPLTALLLDECSDSDASIITVNENEGRVDPHVFAIVDSYVALMMGKRPVSKDVSELARRLGKSRTWISSMISISKLPKRFVGGLSIEDKYRVSASSAISIARRYNKLTSESKIRLDAQIEEKTTVHSFKALLERHETTTKRKTKNESIQRVVKKEEIKEGSYIVASKEGDGVFISMPEGFSLSEKSHGELIKYITKIQSL